MDQKKAKLSQRLVKQSIVFDEDAVIAFTHERDAQSSVIEATELFGKSHFDEIRKRFDQIELSTFSYFPIEDDRPPA